MLTHLSESINYITEKLVAVSLRDQVQTGRWRGIKTARYYHVLRRMTRGRGMASNYW